MYCKLCGKWVDGSATLCEDCARRQAAAAPAPGEPAAISAPGPAAPETPAAKPPASAAKPVPKTVPPAPRPPYYGMYGRPADEKPLNGCAVGGFVLAVINLLPQWAIGMQFAQEGDMLYRFLFLFLPMAIFQSIAIVLSIIGLRSRAETRGGIFAKVGLLVAIVGLLMFLEMFIAGLVLYA